MEIRELPQADVKRVVAKIQQLASNPRMPDSKKLTSLEQYRVRVGQYRILYEIRDDVLVVTVVRVANRPEAHRFLMKCLSEKHLSKLNFRSRYFREFFCIPIKIVLAFTKDNVLR